MARELEALEYEMLLSIPILTVVPCDLPGLVYPRTEIWFKFVKRSGSPIERSVVYNMNSTFKC